MLQFAFAAMLFTVASVFFNSIYHDVLNVIVDEITANITSSTPSDDFTIETSLNLARSSRFVLFSTATLIITVIFTFIISKISLRPVKNVLNTQKRFISDIAHELRTPLSVVKTNNEVALMGEDVPKEMRRMIKSNIEELDRMAEIINNLLSFNSLIRPERIKFSSVDIGPIVDSSVGKLKNLAEKKNLEITVKKVTPHVVWGNAVALEQIVSNLLKNAIKYTNKNGYITIRVGPDYVGNIILHIEDTGIGIKKEDLLHIFEPFYVAERSRNRKHGSSGLGLTIVSELVKMHSGGITIKSSENNGTVAIVTLPYNKKNEGGKNEETVSVENLNEISVNFMHGKRKNLNREKNGS
jgi:signal transduction histidine kinase